MFDRKNAAKKFAHRWKKQGNEISDTQTFWNELLSSVFQVENPHPGYIDYEKFVNIDGKKKRIDGFISREHEPILIEQKSFDVSLDAKEKQSDGSMLTPYEQAYRYSQYLNHNENPKWIVISNFQEFRVYDNDQVNHKGYLPTVILLKDLPNKCHLLNFLGDPSITRITEETELSAKAGILVSRLYELLYKQYKIDTLAPASPEQKTALKSLNIFCVRLIFCLYSEDANLFGVGGSEFIRFAGLDDQGRSRTPSDFRTALKSLFVTLNTKKESRDQNDDPRLNDFPYVNGGLFAEEIEIPEITPEIMGLIIKDCGEQFDWKGISPTIFGSVFESTLNPLTRRSGGMHYTSIANIHKVIDPLFLADLQAEFDLIKKGLGPSGAVLTSSEKYHRFENLRSKIASLTFFDPACGSGNFLTETYICLRRLENAIIREETGYQILLDTSQIKVSINQFYGIEINDFAVAVAKTALWIAEAQMFSETKSIVASVNSYYETNWEFFPLKTNSNIYEGDALTTNWSTVIRRDKVDYIMGNPPFVGYGLQTKQQKEELISIYTDEHGKPYPSSGKIDYVAGWFFKTAKFISNNHGKAALVATNSITQGEQVSSIWQPLIKRFKVHIDFAYKSFVWNNEASEKAHVHCVVVGFSSGSTTKPKVLFDKDGTSTAHEHLNPYLLDGPDIFVENLTKPICQVPDMTTGNRPADGGHLIVEEKDYQEFLQKEPDSKKYLKKLVGAEEFLNGHPRYCLWLVGSTPAERTSLPMVNQRVNECYLDRLASPDSGRRKLADTPWLFRETLNPNNAVLIPASTSGKRKYIPIGYIDNNSIATNAVLMISDAPLWLFSVLTSSVHMVWMSFFCGRLKSDYRYSRNLVYNNFPWPELTEDQKQQLTLSGQAILDARSRFPDSPLSVLYNDVQMPIELKQAHKQNDLLVQSVFGFNSLMSDSEIASELLRRNQSIILANKKAISKSKHKKHHKH